MSLFQKIKGCFIIPVIWMRTLTCKGKSEVEIYAIFRRWSMRLLSFLGYCLEVEGSEHIPSEGPVYFVSNHQGTLDPALVVASCPLPMAFISKKENEKMPIFGRCAKLLGNIHFDRESREGNIYMLRESVRRMKMKKSILIFPEGTRSKGDQMNEFKAGALQPAYMAKATIVPITLNNAYCIDDKNTKNKQLKITYGKPFKYSEYSVYKADEMSDILHKQIEDNILQHEKIVIKK